MVMVIFALSHMHICIPNNACGPGDWVCYLLSVFFSAMVLYGVYGTVFMLSAPNLALFANFKL